MKIKKVEIDGFRAYRCKEDGTFDFTTESGDACNFAAIYAPNGFGKSSFYDAVEWALTNNLERYIREHHRRTNELAAKGTKQQGEAQFILRNKDATLGRPTVVSIQTTAGAFENRIESVRNDSRDLKFREADTFPGTKCYREIILSQDAIDRFLREVKPQERYEAFMSYFGGNAEQTRKELTSIMGDNASRIELLKNARAGLLEIISLPINENIFSEYNLIAASLNSQGESIKLLSQDFDAVVEHEIVSTIVSRRHELKQDISAAESRVEIINSSISLIPDVERKLSEISAEKPRYENINTALIDRRRHEELTNLIKTCKSDLAQSVAALKDLLSVQSKLDVHKEQSLRLGSLNKESEGLQARQKQIDERVTSIEDLLVTLKSGSTEVNKKIQELDELSINSVNIYRDILSYQETLDSLERDEKSKSTSILLEKILLEDASRELTKISSIVISTTALIDKGMSYLEDEALLDELQMLSDRLEKLDLQSESARRTQKALEEQSASIEKLVALGLDYVSSWETSSCPLCQASHPSYDALKSAIATNAFATEVMLDNANAIELSVTIRKEINNRIDQILLEAQQLKSKQESLLRERVASIQERLEILNKELSDIALRIQNSSRHIDELKEKVLNLAPEDLKKQIESSKPLLERRQFEYSEKIRIESESISALKSERFDCLNKVIDLASSIAAITTNPDFVLVEKFIEKNSLLPLEGHGYLEIKINHLKAEQDRLSNTILESQEECLKIQATMLRVGSWADLTTLENSKKELAKKVNELSDSTSAFFEEVDEILSTKAPRNTESVKLLLVDEALKEKIRIESLDFKSQNLDLLTEHISAFKPYIERVQAQNELAEIEDRLASHLRLDESLTFELRAVLNVLRNHVNSFFYTELINNIYKKIDPHPSFKCVEFKADFDDIERPGLNVVVTDESGLSISPNLYFSAAQVNILSLSVFLARALHAKNSDGESLDLILIDDPIHSMDSINILSTIDLLRNISSRFDKQIIISTHDENFFKLLQKKIPPSIFGSKFLRLESYGVVAAVPSDSPIEDATSGHLKK